MSKTLDAIDKRISARKQRRESQKPAAVIMDEQDAVLASTQQQGEDLLALAKTDSISQKLKLLKKNGAAMSSTVLRNEAEQPLAAAFFVVGEIESAEICDAIKRVEDGWHSGTPAQMDSVTEYQQRMSGVFVQPVQPAIRAILEIISSKRDSSGNCYWAFRLTDTTTGKVLEINSPHSDSSNIRTAVGAAYDDGKTNSRNFYSVMRELPKKLLRDMVDGQKWQTCTRGTVDEITAAIQAWRATL